ncbi:hypothetical protein HDU98_003096 [Podochytrium sp. JEL0797]|nr:hypothetical protein HDU98_003096 [Podochytrium sp. JEL0797]
MDISLLFLDLTADAALYQQERSLRFDVLRKPLIDAGMIAAPNDALTQPFAFPFEPQSVHLVAVDPAGDVVGCVLFHAEDASRSGRLYQMAVRKDQRGKRVGVSLVRTLEDHLCKARSIQEVTLHARADAVPFYQKLGYEIYGDMFVEVGIDHFHMRRSLE